MITPLPKLRVVALFQEHGATIHDYLFNYLWKNHGIRVDCRRIEDAPRSAIEHADVVLNAACNNSFQRDRLAQLERAADHRGTPFINRPGALEACEREHLSRLLIDAGIGTARVRNVRTVDELTSASDLKFPLILRDELAHLGSTMKHVQDHAAALALHSNTFGPRTIAAEFHDFADADGFYRKYRCALVGEQAIPRHVISSRHWNIHADSRDMEREQQHRDENAEFLDQRPHEADELLKAKALTGLDYAIVDYARGADGRPFIFELNPCYSIMDAQTFKRPWSPALAAVHTYGDAFADMLYETAERPKPYRTFTTEPMVL